MTKKQDILYKIAKNNLKNCKNFCGIDYGTKRIGVALSDSSHIARPFKIISHIKELDDIIPAYNIECFVMGWPLQSDGTVGGSIANVLLFSHRLMEKFNLPIVYIDERLTSVKTQQQLENLFYKEKTIKKTLDASVAALLLQTFLNNFR